MPKKLTDLQERFCQEFQEDFDEEAAVRRAGYNVRSDADCKRLARQLITNHNVQDRLAGLRLERSGLNERQKTACRHYLMGCTQAEAWRRAGYSDESGAARINASHFFSRPDVKQYLRELQRSLSIAAQVDDLWVLRKLKTRVETVITDVADISPDGTIAVRDLNQVPRDVLESIQEISTTISEEGHRTTRIKLKPDEFALKMIARYTGFDSDWNTMLRTAEKYGYSVRPTERGGYELVPMFAAPGAIDVQAKEVDEPDR